MTDEETKECGWKDCKNRIPTRYTRKFCCKLCNMKFYNYRPGFPIYVGYCECGCGGIWCSTIKKKRFIKNHPLIDNTNKLCEMCCELGNGFKLKQADHVLKVCENCYVKIMDLKRERIIINY